jgi:hypothetical protein
MMARPPVSSRHRLVSAEQYAKRLTPLGQFAAPLIACWDGQPTHTFSPQDNCWVLTNNAQQFVGVKPTLYLDAWQHIVVLSFNLLQETY